MCIWDILAWVPLGTHIFQYDFHISFNNSCSNHTLNEHESEC